MPLEEYERLVANQSFKYDVSERGIWVPVDEWAELTNNHPDYHNIDKSVIDDWESIYKPEIKRHKEDTGLNMGIVIGIIIGASVMGIASILL